MAGINKVIRCFLNNEWETDLHHQNAMIRVYREEIAAKLMGRVGYAGDDTEHLVEYPKSARAIQLREFYKSKVTSENISKYGFPLNPPTKCIDFVNELGEILYINSIFPGSSYDEDEFATTVRKEDATFRFSVELDYDLFKDDEIGKLVTINSKLLPSHIEEAKKRNYKGNFLIYLDEVPHSAFPLKMSLNQFSKELAAKKVREKIKPLSERIRCIGEVRTEWGNIGLGGDMQQAAPDRNPDELVIHAIKYTTDMEEFLKAIKIL